MNITESFFFNLPNYCAKSYSSDISWDWGLLKSYDFTWFFINCVYWHSPDFFL